MFVNRLLILVSLNDVVRDSYLQNVGFVLMSNLGKC
jgi:hypothetical protein